MSLESLIETKSETVTTFIGVPTVFEDVVVLP
jgi:hypothetical protein